MHHGLLLHGIGWCLHLVIVFIVVSLLVWLLMLLFVM